MTGAPMTRTLPWARQLGSRRLDEVLRVAPRLGGTKLGIRIVVDRGQWFVEVHPGADGVSAVGWEGWFTLEAWSACLGEPVVLHDTRPTLTDEDWAAVLANSWWLQPQLDFLQGHLIEIDRACQADRVEATLRCLGDAQRRQSAFPPG